VEVPGSGRKPIAHSKVVESEEVKPGIVLDFNAKKQVVGIEVLDLKRRGPKADLRQLKVLVA
jgi:ribosomal 50S subunit-recycling heat shock protein